jgi:SAM-dependent methyltransferase
MNNNKDNSNWFKFWFNSEYYHLLYNDRNEKEANLFIEHLTKHLSIPKESHVLDLACGKGRHALALSNYYSFVTGTDISENSILTARNLEKNGLDFYVHDLRNLFRTNYFHLITNLFTSFGYFEKEQDNYNAAESIAKGLKPEGVFVIDFLNAHKVIKNLVASESKVKGDITFHIKRNFDGRFIKKNISFSDGAKDFEVTEQVQGIKLEQFRAYFDQAGLKINATFGDYQLNPFDLESSDRLIIIAQKEE